MPRTVTKCTSVRLSIRERQQLDDLLQEGWAFNTAVRELIRRKWGEMRQRELAR